LGLLSGDKETGPVRYKKRRLLKKQNITIVRGDETAIWPGQFQIAGSEISLAQLQVFGYDAAIKIII